MTTKHREEREAAEAAESLAAFEIPALLDEFVRQNPRPDIGFSVAVDTSSIPGPPKLKMVGHGWDLRTEDMSVYDAHTSIFGALVDDIDSRYEILTTTFGKHRVLTGSTFQIRGLRKQRSLMVAWDSPSYSDMKNPIAYVDPVKLRDNLVRVLRFRSSLS